MNNHSATATTTLPPLSRGDDAWAVVLAGGEGQAANQSGAKSRGVEGGPRAAKAHGVLGDEERPWLRKAMDRLQALAPPSRSVVVVGSHERRDAENHLRLYKGVQIVEQPDDLGTGPAVLASLAVVTAQAPSAVVVVMPSDQDLQVVEPFVASIQKAVVAARSAPAGLAIVGAEPSRADEDLGWIVPCGDAGGLQFDVGRVDHFVEKPQPDQARQLLAHGALWNTKIVVGTVDSFWRQARRHLPSQTLHFDKLVSRVRTDPSSTGGAISENALARTYESLCPADFGRALLEQTEGLAVVSLRRAGWRPQPVGIR